LRSFAAFIAAFQSVLFVAHLFLYETFLVFFAPLHPSSISTLRLALAVLSVSFVSASVLAFRYNNLLLRIFYRISAVWLGTFSFCFIAAFSCWLIYPLFLVTKLHIAKSNIALVMFAVAIGVSTYGVINANATRITRVNVKLTNLPAAWHGRTAALVSDMHLGHVWSIGLVRRIVRMLARLRPEMVFIAGDMYDGTKADLERLAQPLKAICAPLGIYFIAGNHEEFREHSQYLRAVSAVGVRVLNNEKIIVDGLQIVGVHYRDATHREHFRKTLRNTGLDRQQPSILLTHAPDPLKVAAQEGISLHVCGHTHRGQFFPFTWITKRMYGKYVYGLQRADDMQVYTSSGVATWGPPLRVGSWPEIVLITFE
jgi:predicted MPP superfamily phosphohydrolase